LAVLLAGATTGAAWAQQGPPDPFTRKVTLDIPAQPLADALRALGEQSGIAVLIQSQIGLENAPALKGSYTPNEALQRLLAATGLHYEYLDPKTVAVLSQGDILKGGQSPLSLSEQREKGEGSNSDGPQQSQTLSGHFRLAQANSNGAQSDSSAENAQQPAQREPVGLEEVLVTAQKKGEERLQDVPVPVTVVDTESLTQSSQVLIRDWYSSVPNLNVAPSVDGVQLLLIRGIATSVIDVPAVGVVIDDVPYGTQSYNSSSEYPEIDPGDLDHIEVLRGPQGTLYGANSMGGLLKIVTKDPSTAGFSGRMETGVSGVQNGAEPGFDLHGSLNVPVTNTLAVRASAFKHQDAGYIDDPALSLRGVNERESDGARLAALWRPSGVFSLKLSALYQTSHLFGASEADALPGLGSLQQSRIANTGWETRTAQAYSAIANAHLGDFELVSITGYNDNSFNSALDYSFSLGPAADGIFGVKGAPFFFHLEAKKFTQELRFTAPVGEHLSWEAGGYYTHENKPNYGLAQASDPSTGQIAGNLGLYDISSGYQEYSGFTNLTVKVTDRIDMQLGGRESHTEVTTPTTVNTGIFAGVGQPTSASANTFTYLATPRFKVTPDIMLYARFASGFRPGSANTPVVVAKGAPAVMTPDTTKNYELGAKVDLFDHALFIDTSVYYIDWNNIQLGLSTADGFAYAANGGSAKSEGAEFSVNAIPWTGSTVSTWVVFQDAELTEDLPRKNSTVVGSSGARLPFSSRFSANLSFDQSFPLMQDLIGFASGTVSYVGDRIGPFQSAPQRQVYPAYTKTDFKAGVNIDTWTINAYVNNVFNTRALLNGGIGYTPNWARDYISPRTIGVSAVKTFNLK